MASRVDMEVSGESIRMISPPATASFMTWYDAAGARKAWMWFGGAAHEYITIRNDVATGYQVFTGAQGYNVVFDAMADGHTRIRGSNGPIIKFLKTLEQVQFRNFADAAYASIVSSGHTTVSKREYKKNITPYEGDAIYQIVTTPIREWQYLNDFDWEIQRLGVIVDGASLEVLDLTR
ncbi:hypothetical protein C8K15_101144 [Paenisporosarcina sp. OV554]|nr:hypothetical protein C8K15_101144 [Paenisporosarcina sp. OV554]